MSVARKFRIVSARGESQSHGLPSSLHGGSAASPSEDGGHHRSNAPITTKLLTALIQNGAAMPSPTMTPTQRRATGLSEEVVQHSNVGIRSIPTRPVNTPSNRLLQRISPGYVKGFG